MNNNTRGRFKRLKKADRQAMANHGRQSKKPKVAFSAKKFCRSSREIENIKTFSAGGD